MEDITQTSPNACTALWEFPPEPAEPFFSIIHELNNSAKLLCLIASSVRLGIFDALDDWQSESELEKIIQYPHPITDYVNGLILSGLVESRDGKIRNTRLSSTYLSRHSPYFQGAFLDKTVRHLKDLWTDLPSIVTSGPIHYNEEEFFSELSLPSMAQNAMCGRLQEVVQAISALPAFFGMRKMIDLGGGHGLYAIALACKNPSLLAVVFDLPGVIALTRKYIARYAMDERVIAKEGNFLNGPIGSNYDLILSSSNPSGKSPDMVEKISKALKKGGFFVSIQPGDEMAPYDPLKELEFSLWSFKNVTIPKKAWSKNKKFLTSDYLTALKDQKLSVHSVTRISDPYMKDYGVTMLIAKKDD